MRARSFYRVVALVVLFSMLIATSLAASAADSHTNSQSTTSTYGAQADATVKSSYPATNFGTATSLSVDGSPSSRSYLRFTVSGLNGATISSAQLKIYARTSSQSSVSVKSVADDTWPETAITYQTAPALGSSTSTSASSFSSGTWVTLDLTSRVKTAGVYSIALTTSSATAVSFASREAGSSTAPRLVLTLGSPVAPTSTPGTVLPTPTSPSGASWQPSFPIRATFYYPWFPEAWKQSGIYPYTNYTPTIGYYSSTDPTTLKKHIDMMQYAHIQAGIASWWGQGSQTDTKIAGLLQAASGTNFRWTLYYEMENQGDPSASQIQSDLTYIRDHYGKDPSFLRVNGKFVVFVYPAGNDACSMVDRWKQGNTVGAYVVLKVFTGYKNCANQPDNWHQYSPAIAASQQGNYSYSISPGFWLVGHNVVLARNVTRWTQNVKDMVASGAQWQLVTTFSEWGEGTAVEPAQEWASSSGYGQYLDALHNTP